MLIISDRICDSVGYRINNHWNNILCIDILNIVIVMLEAETYTNLYTGYFMQVK